MIFNTPIRFIFLIFFIIFSLAKTNLGSKVQPVIKVVHDDVAALGEAPYWDPVEQVLYYVDAALGDFIRLNPVSRELRKVHIGNGLVGFIIPYQNEKESFIVSRNNEILKLNFEKETIKVIATVRGETPGRENFNDAKCDPEGRLFTGTYLLDEQGQMVPHGGALYRLDGDKVTPVAVGFSVTNGMAFSNDKKKLYLNDSEGRKIYHFDYNLETGELSNQRVLIDLDESPGFHVGEQPDGMIMDNQGYIWSCMWRGGRIVKIDPELGQLVDEVILPNVTSPSSLASGYYEGQFGYFITSASIVVPPDQLKPYDGKILHMSFEGGQVSAFIPS